MVHSNGFKLFLCVSRERGDSGKKQNMQQREKEIYSALEKEGERNCSFQGLAAFQAVWLWFWRPPVFLFVLPPDWLDPEVAFLPAWSKRFQSPWHRPLFAAGWKQSEERFTRPSSAPLLRPLLSPKAKCELAGIWASKQTLTSSRMSPAWEPGSQDGFFFPSTTTELLWKSLTGNIFCPSGSGERVETFLVGQWAIKDPKTTPFS